MADRFPSIEDFDSDCEFSQHDHDCQMGNLTDALQPRFNNQRKVQDSRKLAQRILSPVRRPF